MSPSADQFRAYLALREPVVAVSTGTLFETSSWDPVSIGLTDRRLLCVTQDGQVITVDYDAICMIQSRPRTTQTYRGMDYRLPMGVGGLIALLGGVGVVVFATSVLVALFTLVTVGGLITAESLRRCGDEVQPNTTTEVAKYVPYDVDDRILSRLADHLVPDTTEEREVLVIGSGGVALVSFVGLVLLVSSGYVVLGVCTLVGGIALVDYSIRHRSEFDGIDVSRHHETEVSISTNADRTIHIRSDSSEEFVRELNRVTFMNQRESNQLVSSTS